MWKVQHYIRGEGAVGTWYFRTKTLALAYRNGIIGTDNPSACDGTWTLYRIGPDALPDHKLVTTSICSWKYIGGWSGSGNTHIVIRKEEAS